MNIRAWRNRAERECPLLLDGIERLRRAGRNYKQIAALLENPKFLQREWSFPELLLNECYGAANAECGDAMVRESLDSSRSCQIAEVVEAFAPARSRTHEPQPFPVAKAARVKS
jgi:hypothetical protein